MVQDKDMFIEEGPEEEEEGSVLSRIAVDMRKSLFSRRFGSIVPWKSEVVRLLETLQKRSHHNILLYGSIGVGKRTMVLRLAEKLASGRVPSQLRNKRILELSVPSILPYVREAGDFESMLFMAVKEAVERGNVILYFNDLENFLAASAGGLGDAATLLEVATRQQQLQVITSISTWGYQNALNEFPWISSNLVPIHVSEPSQEMSRKILLVVRGKLERFHDIEITEDAVDKAIDLSSYYLRDRVLPGKALEILDEACAAEAVRTQGRRAKLYPVNAATVARAVSKKLGIPVSKLHDRFGSKLLHLEENLQAHIKGQDRVLKKVSDVIRVAKINICANKERPDGVFLFIGPSGVGKNALAQRLSHELLGSDAHLIHLDMNQFAGEDAAEKLLGVSMPEAIPGILASVISRRPSAVLLVDGIEKAHPRVGPILLQILKEGWIIDEGGKRLSFANSTIVVIANSDNILPDEDERTVGFTESGQEKKIAVQRKAIESATKEFFASEFLNAFDEVLYFDPLTPESIHEIAAIEIEKIRGRLSRRGIDMKVPANVIKLISARGYSTAAGAHKLSHTVENIILRPVSLVILKNPMVKKLYLDVIGNKVRVRLRPSRKTRRG